MYSVPSAVPFKRICGHCVLFSEKRIEHQQCCEQRHPEHDLNEPGDQISNLQPADICPVVPDLFAPVPPWYRSR